MYDDAVSVFSHEYDVGAVDDDFLVVQSVANQYLERLCWALGSLLYGILYALAGIDYRVEFRQVGLRGAVHVYQSALVGARRVETDVQFVGGVIFVCPFFVKRVDEGRTVAVPGIAVAALCAYLPKMSAGHTVTVAYERLAVLQVVVSCPYGRGGMRVFYEFGSSER